MTDTLSNQQLSTLRARQNAGGGAAGLAPPAPQVLGPTAVPANGNVPNALATPNVPPASPQASGLVNNIQSLVGQAAAAESSVEPLESAPGLPFQPAAGGFAGNLRSFVQRATAARSAPIAPQAVIPSVAPPRSTSFGRQNTDRINPQSLL